MYLKPPFVKCRLFESPLVCSAIVYVIPRKIRNYMIVDVLDPWMGRSSAAADVACYICMCYKTYAQTYVLYRCDNTNVPTLHYITGRPWAVRDVPLDVASSPNNFSRGCEFGIIYPMLTTHQFWLRLNDGKSKIYNVSRYLPGNIRCQEKYLRSWWKSNSINILYLSWELIH